MPKRSSRICRPFGNGSACSPADPDDEGLRYYLLVYNTGAQRLADEPVEFLRGDEAESAFVATEKRFREQGALQVLMFVARSLDSVRSTHPHYFDDATEAGDDTVEF